MSEPKISTMGAWLDNAFEPGKFLLVDCGYLRHPKARSHADRLLASMGVSKKTRGYLQIVGAGRVVVRVPRAKERILSRFRLIKKGVSYSWTTHTYDAKGPQFNLKFAS